MVQAPVRENGDRTLHRYGDLYMIWFDGGAMIPVGDGPDVEPIVNKYQPNCLFYHNIDRADFRWGGRRQVQWNIPAGLPFPSLAHTINALKAISTSSNC